MLMKTLPLLMMALQQQPQPLIHHNVSHALGKTDMNEDFIYMYIRLNYHDIIWYICIYAQLLHEVV